jgi:cyanophycinase-like exopeptidase
MPQELQPIYLLADSQLLFWKNGNALFLESILIARPRPLRAAYIGASNGDAREYYDIFQAAMQGIGVNECQLIHSAFSSRDEAFLNDADIILLAGGDVAAGWKVISETGMKDAVIRRYNAGATIAGVSAGAVQLGMYGLSEGTGSSGELLETFKLCPFVVSAHDEKNEWSSLANVVHLLEGAVQGLGIPAGAGLVCHPDQSIEPVRSPVSRLFYTQGAVGRDLLLPKA